MELKEAINKMIDGGVVCHNSTGDKLHYKYSNPRGFYALDIHSEETRSVSFNGKLLGWYNAKRKLHLLGDLLKDGLKDKTLVRVYAGVKHKYFLDGNTIKMTENGSSCHLWTSWFLDKEWYVE